MGSKASRAAQGGKSHPPHRTQSHTCFRKTFICEDRLAPPEEANHASVHEDSRVRRSRSRDRCVHALAPDGRSRGRDRSESGKSGEHHIGDQFSRQFSSPTTATDFTYTADTAGTFNYFCGIHGYTAQHGSLVVQGTGGGGGGTAGGIDTTLLIGGVVIIVAIVAVVAAIVMRRKKP